MKHTIKSMVAAVMAGLLMTSCIDTAVSPELQALREQQVALMTARANLAALQAEQQRILNEYNEANYDILVATAQVTLDLALANNETALINAQAALVGAEAALATAVMNLEIQLATQGQTEALKYLDLYATAMGKVNTLLGERLVAQASLTRAELMLNGADVPFDLLQEEFERDLAEAEAELVAEELALEVYLGVVADPSTVGEEVATLTGEIADHEDALAAHDVEIRKRTNAKNAADSAVIAAQELIAEYDGLVTDRDDALEAIEAKNDSIVDQTEVVAEAQQDLADLNAELDLLNDQIAPYQDEIDLRQAAYDDLYDEATVLYNEYLVALAEFDAVNDNYSSGDPEFDDAEAALQVAEDALDDIIGDVTGTATPDMPDAGSDLDDAADLLATAEGEPQYVSLDTQIDAKIMAIATAEGTLETEQDFLGEIEARLAAEQGIVAQAEEDMEEIQDVYDDAVAGMAALLDAQETAGDELAAEQDARAATESLRYNKQEVVDVLTTQLTAIEGAITAKRDEIEQTKRDIAEAEVALEDNQIDIAEQETKIEQLEAELAAINEELAQWQAVAQDYKDLLDAAIGG